MRAQLTPVREWHLVISGFLQNEGKPTGMVRLWRTLSEAHSGPCSRVELRSYNDNWRQTAELIFRMEPRDAAPTVKVYAYSWGAGYGAMALARQLRRRGLRVAHMVLSDPVGRPAWLPLRWLALVPRRKIVVPDNVDRVTWLRQRRSCPAGHDLTAENPRRTAIEPPLWAEVAHAYMDDLRRFHVECHRVAGGAA